jgi:hypothetical protein
MSKVANKPPSGEPWVWLTRELLESDAWRSLGTSSRRFVDFLLLEHMSKGGKQNGKLKAPYRQLVAFGVGARFASAAIREAEEVGVVNCARGGMRVATTYGLAWLPQHDGTVAPDRWRSYHNPTLAPISRSKCENLPAKGNAGLPAKGDADGVNLPAKGDADTPKNLPAKGDALYRDSYQGEADRDRAGGCSVDGRCDDYEPDDLSSVPGARTVGMARPVLRVVAR